MANMKVLLVVLLFAVVVTAGCIGQRPVRVDATNGLKVVEFSADPQEVREDDNVIFSLEVENVGGITARNVAAELIGIENQWRDPSGNPLTSTEIRNLGNLRPPDPQFNIPGDFKRVQWFIKTPSLPPGIVQTWPIIAKVLFNYKTTGLVQVKLIGRNYLTFQYGGNVGNIPEPATISNTNAPLQINVREASRRAIIVDESGDLEQVQSFVFVLKNVGDGFPITQLRPGQVFGNVSISGPCVFKDCLGKTVAPGSPPLSGFPSVEITDKNPITAELAKLSVSTKEVPIACTIIVNRDYFIQRGGTAQEDLCTVTFDLDYTYFVQQKQDVKIFAKVG